MKQNKTLLRGLLAVGCIAVFAIALLLVNRKGTPTVQGDESPRPPDGWYIFGGTPQRNFVNTVDKNIPEKWDVEKGEGIKWSTDLGSKAYGGPIVSGGRVYIGTNNSNPRDPSIKGDKGVLQCFDEKTGKFLWQLTFDKLAAGRVQDWPEEGICSSPQIEGDRLYFISNRCEVVCADVKGDPDKPGKGKVLWTYDMIAKQGVFPHNLAVCSPLIIGDSMYIVTANGVDEKHIDVPAPEAPSFLCLKKKDGEFVWKSNLPSQSLVDAKKAGGNVSIKDLINKGKLLMHGQWSNAVFAEPKGKPQVIFPGGDGWLYSFEPKTGELLWKFDCNPRDSFYELGPKATRNDFIGTPIVWQDKLYIAVGQDPEHKSGIGHMWCIDITKTPANKEKDLSPQDDRFDPKDPKNKDSSLLWHYGGPVPKGQKANRPYLFARSMSTCAVHDGLCYAADMNGYVFCFDANTGQKYWEHDTEQDTWSSPYWVDEKVFFGNDAGQMFVFKHGKEKKILSEIEMGGKIRATAAAANGTLFVITENKTKLYAIGKK